MKTVFHLNSGQVSKQSELLGNIQNLIDDKEVEVEKISVVINSNAIKMVEKESQASEFIQEFLEKDIEFNACSNSLDNIDFGEENVIEGVKIVGSGVGRLNMLIDQGFNYIKI